MRMLYRDCWCLACCFVFFACANPTDFGEFLKHSSEIIFPSLESSVNDYSGEVPLKRYGNRSKVQNAFKYVTLEPDAEMLPLHYTRVKPPGVDHMEMRSQGSELNKASSDAFIEESALVDHHLPPEKLLENAGENNRNIVSNKKSNGKIKYYDSKLSEEMQEDGRKVQDAKNDGKKHKYVEDESQTLVHKDDARDERSSILAGKENFKSDHDTAGYSNIYYKDKYKADAEFYKSDRQDSQFKKRGNSDEKYITTEGSCKMCANKNAGFVRAEPEKESAAQKERIRSIAQEHDVRRQDFMSLFENL